MPKKRYNRRDRAAIRRVGYHEFACGNREGAAYGDGYEAGYRAAMSRVAKRNAMEAKRDLSDRERLHEYTH